MQGTSFRLIQATMAAVLTVAIAVPVLADPPHWAPAHGYRDKHREYRDHDDYREYREYHDRRDYRPRLPWHDRAEVDTYISGGRCDRDRLGAVLGGAVGGITGSRIGKGDGRAVATIAGTVIGILVGRSIGQSMNQSDQQCTGQTLEYTPDQVPVRWRNPDSGAEYQVTPVNTFRDPAGRYCREYTTQAMIGGRPEQVYGRACRQPDGSWIRI